MVPKNIAIAGPESAAMLLVPPYLLWIRAARPVHRVLQLVRHMTLRAFGVEAKDELENTVSTRRAVRDDRRVAVRGSARPRGAQPAVAGAADPQPRRRRRRGAARRDPRGAGAPPTVRARPSAADRAGARRDRATPASRSPIRRRSSPATCTSRTCCRSSTTRTPWSTRRWCGRCRRCRRRCRCPTRCPAAARQQPPGAGHRRRRQGDRRWWRWRTWSRTWSATVRDGTHRV